MELISRDHYLEKVLRFRDSDLIKVVTGIRRCGKSTLLEMIAAYFIAEGASKEQIIKLNLESKKEGIPKDEDSLYNYFKHRLPKDKRAYLFIDEVQRIRGWENAVNGMRVDFNCDIYVTGSNAYLLSSELATYLSGRYIEIKMLPLTFEEYLRFRGFNIESVLGLADNSPSSNLYRNSPDLISDGDAFYLTENLFNEYRQVGGMPALSKRSVSLDRHREYMRTLDNSIVTRDILDRERAPSRRMITNPDLLRRLQLFLADNIGNSNSFNSINNSLKAEHLNHTNQTIEAYIKAMEEAYLFYSVQRFDIKGKQYLKTLGKHYIADVGLRNYLLGYRDTDRGRVLENIIFCQLLYNGFDVSIGKTSVGEVDFIATKPGLRMYIQVTDDMRDEMTQEREMKPFRTIPDAYPRYIIVGEGSYPVDIEGVRIVKAIDFLLGKTYAELKG